MRIRINMPDDQFLNVKNELMSLDIIFENEMRNTGDSSSIVCLISPGYYRMIHEMLEKLNVRNGYLEVVNLVATAETENTQIQECNIKKDENEEIQKLKYLIYYIKI